MEITAVLAAVFQEYSVELDVREWASDEEVGRMTREQRRDVYAKAVRKAEATIRKSDIIITLRLLSGTSIPLRYVKRGTERFGDVGLV